MKEGQYREPQVEGRPLAGDRGFTERAVDRLPNYLAAGVGELEPHQRSSPNRRKTI